MPDGTVSSERDFPSEMIEWLSDKNPDIWFYVSEHLNWDFSEDVLEWIVAQPNCDKANVSLIFCRLVPDDFLTFFEEGQSNDDIEYFNLFVTIVKNWKSGFYSRSELALDPAHVGSLQELYEAAVKARPDQTDPFDVPLDIFGPFTGRAPRIPENLDGSGSRLRELFRGLGTHFGDL